MRKYIIIEKSALEGESLQEHKNLAWLYGIEQWRWVLLSNEPDEEHQYASSLMELLELVVNNEVGSYMIEVRRRDGDDGDEDGDEDEQKID